MAKVKSLFFSHLRTFVNTFDQDVLSTDGIILLCKVFCNVKIV